MACLTTAVVHWCRQANWLLIDGLKAGSGETYDWDKLQAPKLETGTQGWLLAGGLTPENVRRAIMTARPLGVDVSSGVSGPDGLRKDPEKILRFVEEVRHASQNFE